MKMVSSIILASIITISSHAADIEAGKAKSAVCTACHGQNGISRFPLYPNLAGQKEQYLIKQLKAFKAGLRRDATMVAMSVPLSDEDIRNLAAFYANLPIDNQTNEQK